MKKELKKIKISLSRILRKKSRVNSFYNEIPQKFQNESDDKESAIEIHLITIVSFNTLSRQRNVEIFAVSMKNLKIQLKKQDSNTIIDSKSVILLKYHDFLNVFSKEKANILSLHRKHNHRIKFEKIMNQIMNKLKKLRIWLYK